MPKRQRKTTASVAEAERIQPTPDDVILGLERRFTIGDREAVLRPLVIGERKRVGMDVALLAQKVAAEHPEIDLAHPEQHIEAIFLTASDQIGRILERLLGIEQDYLDEHLSFVQLSELVVALLEVNQLPVIRKNLARALQLAKTVA